MKRILNKFFSNRIIINIIKMLSGTMMGQLISILTVPITSRIYGAELYGDLAVFTSMSSICTSFLGFGLASAIMVEKTDYEAMQTYKIAINLTNVAVILIAMIAVILSPFIQFIKSSLPYVGMIGLVAFYVITTNQINMLYAWLNRKGKYNVLLFNPIITPIVNNGFAIILGLIGFTNVGLYVGLVVAQLITLLHMFRHMDKIEYRLRYRDVGSIIKRNKDFVLYQYPASLMNTVVGNLPVQILSVYFGNIVVGYYSMAMKLLNIPTSILSSSITRVYFKEATDIQHANGNTRAYTYKLCKIVMSIYLIPIVGILMLGDLVIPFVLGAEWTDSVIYIKIMAVWNLFVIGTNCSSGFASVINKQKINMFISLAKLLVLPIVMIVSYYLWRNPYVTLILYVLSYAVINTTYYEKLIGEDKTLKYEYLKLSLLFGGIVSILCLLFSLIPTYL